jgi:hypothetical protein
LYCVELPDPTTFGVAVGTVSMPLPVQPRLPQPSRECTVRNSFTQRQTGYIRKEQLLKFLRTNFGANKEYGIQVYAFAQHQLLEELLLI